MKFAINIVQIVLSVALIASILLQSRGGGLSPVLGGEGSVYRTRRGVERIIFTATITLSILFFATAIVNIYLR